MVSASAAAAAGADAAAVMLARPAPLELTLSPTPSLPPPPLPPSSAPPPLRFLPLPHRPPPPPHLPSSRPRRDPETCPEGWIPLVVAENKLGNDLVLQRLEAAGRGFPRAVMNYSGMKGTPELQGAMARLLERFLLPGHAVDPADLCISSGG